MSRLSVLDNSDTAGDDVFLRECALEQKCVDGELHFQQCLEALELDEGFEPNFDPCMDMGLDRDDGYRQPKSAQAKYSADGNKKNKGGALWQK